MHKYRSHIVKADGHTFDSKAEYKRYLELQLLAKGKEIDDIAVHPKFPAIVNGTKICVIEFDFAYTDKNNGSLVLEDVKGIDTPMSKLKRKLFKALYPDMDLRILMAR